MSVDLVDFQALQLARLRVVRRELLRRGRFLLSYDAEATHALAAHGLALQQCHGAIDILAEAGAVRLRATATGVPVELAEAEVAP